MKLVNFTPETGSIALMKSDFHSDIQDPCARCERELKILVLHQRDVSDSDELPLPC